MGSAHNKFDTQGREKVGCRVCEEYHHRLDVHIAKQHEMTVAQYRKQYPGAPVLSETAKANDKHKDATSKATIGKSDIESSNQFKIGAAVVEVRTDLSPSDTARIPPHDPHWLPGKHEKEQMEYLALGIQNGENIFIYGPNGCGKTALIEELAVIINQPYVRIQSNRKLTIEDFVGQNALDLVDGKQVTKWKDGVLPQAMRNGWWLVVDEFCGADAGIMLRLQAVLEGKALVLTENGGEVIPRHQKFRIIATDNTNGRGDNAGLYAGTNVMNEATLDRFGVVIKFDYPDKDTEQRILEERCKIKPDIARKMVEIAQRVRESLENETCYCTFSTRRLISWAFKAVQLADVRRAARIAVTNKLGNEDAKFVEGMIQRYFGGEV
jgi:cobaltochelatase CobS